MESEKKFRFYYSDRQQNIRCEIFNIRNEAFIIPAKYTLVKTQNGYKQFSQLCSEDCIYYESNWSDAELVYEDDELPEIITHSVIPEFINEQFNQIRSLEEQLKNAIAPKFKIGQEVFMIIDKVKKAKVEKAICTLAKLDEETSTWYSLTDSDGYALRLPEEQVFTTREEAEKRLAELASIADKEDNNDR